MVTTYYLIEVLDSDGNNCTVYDAVVRAASQDEASKRLWAELENWYPDDESDGGYGTFHACDCACEHFVGNGQTPVVGLCDECSETWECGHGGLLTNEDDHVETYATREDALRAHRVYHGLIDLTS